MMRKRSVGEWLVADAVSVSVSTTLTACFIMLLDYQGWLAYLGVGHPTWGQAFFAGFLFSARPSTRADRYVPTD